MAWTGGGETQCPPMGRQGTHSLPTSPRLRPGDTHLGAGLAPFSPRPLGMRPWRRTPRWASLALTPCPPGARPRALERPPSPWSAFPADSHALRTEGNAAHAPGPYPRGTRSGGRSGFPVDSPVTGPLANRQTLDVNSPLTQLNATQVMEKAVLLSEQTHRGVQ